MSDMDARMKIPRDPVTSILPMKELIAVKFRHRRIYENNFAQ